MSLIAELKQVMYDLPFQTDKSHKDEFAYFCEHNGISIEYTRARSTWQALAPSAVKPWWLKLNPLRNRTKNRQQTHNVNK